MQARNLATTNVPKILDLKSSSEQIFSKNCRWVPLNNNINNRTGNDTSHTGRIPVRESSIVYPTSQQEELISLVVSLHFLRLLPRLRRLTGKT